MKRTQLKDALRNIGKQKVSYLSIIVIAFLGVTTFLGIDYSDGALRRNGSRMYNEVHFRDIEIISTMLLTPEDLADIVATEGVRRAEPVWQTEAKLLGAESRQDVQVISLAESLNLPDVVAGRLPESAGECAVEERIARELGVRIGDTIEARSAKGETAPYLLDGRFTVTGIANHPDHTSVSIPDTPYVLVLAEAFDREELQDCFMKAEIEIDKPEGMDRFSRGYDAAVAAVFARLDALSASRTELRDAEVRGQYQGKIDEGRNALVEAQAQLESARSELDEGRRALTEGERELLENEQLAAEAEQMLAEGWQELLDAKAQLEQAEAELAAAKAVLDTGSVELYYAQQQLAQGKVALFTAWNALEDAKAEVRNGLRSSLEAIVGDTTGQIAWASPTEVDADKQYVYATDFWITTGFKCDLSLSLSENINAFVYSGEIPDEVLRELYERSKGGLGA